MVGTPLVSVVIPAFNRVLVIAEAIQSVLSQSFQDLEIIVVDDGSRDATSQAVSRIAQSEPRIRLIRHEVNRGAQAARNTGVRAALGGWIAFLDSDDTWLSHSVQIRLDAASSQNVHVVHSTGFILRFGGGQLETFEVPPLSGNVYNRLLREAGPVFPS